jgi:hypothetical protein
MGAEENSLIRAIAYERSVVALSPLRRTAGRPGAGGP